MKGMTGKKNMSWINNIKIELGQINTARKELVKFGVLVGIILGLLSFVFDRFDIYLQVISVFLILGGLIYPKILRRIYIVWMSFAVIMGFFVFRIILVILYCVAIIPLGFLYQLFRKEKKNPHTYWQPYVKGGQPEDMY